MPILIFLQPRKSLKERKRKIKKLTLKERINRETHEVGCFTSSHMDAIQTELMNTFWSERDRELTKKLENVKRCNLGSRRKILF